MHTKVTCAALAGVDADIVHVEVDLALGLPAFAIVGLPEGAVKESKVRVLAALSNCGYAVPPRKVTVNLAPADLKKTGSGFDLAIALGMLAGAGLVSQERLDGLMAVVARSRSRSTRAPRRRPPRAPTRSISPRSAGRSTRSARSRWRPPAPTTPS